MRAERIIGEYSGSADGPLLVFVACLHGNEVTAAKALTEVFELLHTHKPDIRGKVVGVTGNLAALDQETRQIDLDMNRVWLAEEDDESITELRERNELIKAIANLYENQEEVYFIDLHATSAESRPFLMISDTLRNRDLALTLGVPIIFGLLEHLHGMLIDVTSLSGIPTLLYQGGQMGQEETQENHKSMIWKMMVAKNKLIPDALPLLKDSLSRFEKHTISPGDPRFYEISYMHELKEETQFSMNPGYQNFQPIRKNEVLGVENGNEAKSPMKGQIFMPLYQETGKEGYYIIRPIATHWIRLSRSIRKFKHHNKLHWLVGVNKVSDYPLTFRLDLQVTFLWALEVFHLLGYIKIRQDKHFLFICRREDELNPPSGPEAMEYFISRAYLRHEIQEIESDWVIPFRESRKAVIQRQG